MISLKNIQLFYGRSLIEDGSMDIYNQQMTGIIGESGCGKTTLLQKIGLLDDIGDMIYTFHNIDVHNQSHNTKIDILRNHICFVMQDIYLFEDYTIGEMIKVYAKLVRKELCDDDIYRLLDDVDLSLDIQTYIHHLSGGEKQRLMIVCGLLKEAELFIFDEPFAYLDDENALRIFQIIQKIAYEEKKMVVISTHDERIYHQFDRIYKIEDRKLSLIKDSKHEDINKTMNEQPFSLSLLYDYIKLNLKKHRVKNICLCLMLSLLISLLVSITMFHENFEKVNGQSLLSLMKNEVIVIPAKGNTIKPKTVAALQSDLYEYNIYSHYVYQNADFIKLKYYLDNEQKSFDIFHELSYSAINDKKMKKPIYMSYSLYRSLQDNQCLYSDQWNQQTLFTASYVLNPTEDNEQSLYIPYADFKSYLKERKIDIGLQTCSYLKIPIQSLEEIEIIEEKLPDDLVINQESFVSTSLDMIKIFNKDYIYIFVVLSLIMILCYKVLDIFKVRKDFILLKIFGVPRSSLILMKGIEEIIVLFISEFFTICFSAILLMVMKIFILETLMNIMVSSLCIYIGIYILTLLLYSLFIMKIPMISLLRKNM